MDRRDTDNKQLIEAARARLRWYTMEASEKEFNVEEVDALVNLLNTLEPQEEILSQEPEQALEEFWEYCAMREADRELIQPLDAETEPDERAEKGYSTESKADESKTEESRTDESGAENRRITSKRVITWKRRSRLIAAAAAVLIIILVAGSSIGGVNAEKGGGFFHWLQKDKEGVLMITSPENLNDNLQDEDIKEYMSIESVPEEYSRYLVDIDNIKQLENYEFQMVEVCNFDRVDKVIQEYACAEQYINIGIMIYEKDILYTKEAYLEYEFLYESEIEGVRQEVYSKINENGKEEYIIYFYNGNSKYYVQGNQQIDFLQEVAVEYMHAVFNK